MRRDLERALDRTTGVDLDRMALAAREGERALGVWAARLEAVCDIKQRLDAAGRPLVQQPRAVPAPARSLGRGARRIPFLWEVLAFAVGFVVSFLVA